MDHNLSLVLHMHPTTFLGDGSSGPLSRCPDVKYSHPSQNPTKVVLMRKGIRPITDQVCTYKGTASKTIGRKVMITITSVRTLYSKWIFLQILEILFLNSTTGNYCKLKENSVVSSKKLNKTISRIGNM